jgi:predicted short-subunit dehydrogenase-like oxidoreductase (DUF2520 family)
MKIGFVGAGKVGFTLGKYFVLQGQEIAGFFSRSAAAAKEAAAFTGTDYFETLDDILSASDILFLTVPDAAISDVWRCLKMLPIQNKIICHCSGLRSSADFDGIDERGAFGYSIHPLFAIGSKTASYKKMSQAIFTVEGHRQYLPYLKQLFTQMGNRVSVIPTQQKTKYHVAAVFLSNHVAALSHVGCRLLLACGFEESFIKAVLNTLFIENCQAIAENGAISALTGPVERNDCITIKEHIESLDNDIKSLYINLSHSLVAMAKEKHPEIDYTGVEKVLNGTQEVLE